MTYADDYIALQFKGLHDVNWGIIIKHKTGDSMLSFPVAFDNMILGEEPVKWDESNSIDDTVYGSSGNIEVCIDGELLTKDWFCTIFITSDILDRRIEVYRNFVLNNDRTYTGEMMFQGVIANDTPNMKLEAYPSSISVNIKDCLASSEDITPVAFVDRVLNNGGYFTQLDLIRWWVEDSGCVLPYIKSNALDTTTKYHVHDFVDFKEEDYRPGAIDLKKIVVSPHTYRDIFETLQMPKMVLRGNTLYVGNSANYGEFFKWSTWVWNGSGYANGNSTTYPQLTGTLSFESKFTVEGDDHSYSIIQPDDTPDAFVEELPDADMKPEKEFCEQLLEGATPTDGMGYCILYKNNYYFNTSIGFGGITIDRKTGTISRSSKEDSLIIHINNPNYNSHLPILKLRSHEPVSAKCLKAILKGQIVKSAVEGSGDDAKDVQKIVYDSDSAFIYVLRWRDLYFNLDSYTWTSEFKSNQLKMKKKRDGSDSNQFFDVWRDAYQLSNGDKGSMVYGGVNYEGIHIPAASGDACGYVELYVYGCPSSMYQFSDSGMICINGLSLEFELPEKSKGSKGGKQKKIEQYTINGCVPGSIANIHDFNCYQYNIMGKTFTPLSIRFRPADDRYELTLYKTIS